MSLDTFSLHWTVDNRVLVATEMRKAAEKAIDDCVEYLRQQANLTVPIEEGMLQDSAMASRDGLTGAVSYNTPYACRQHEELDYRHKAGRRAKWLELTFKEKAATVKARIAAVIGLK